MFSFLTVLNKSPAVLSVTVDDGLVFPELLPDSISKPTRVIYASIRVIIKNSREKLLFDLWLPIKKETSHTLTIWDTSYTFK